MLKYRQAAGFTLVELLVVVTIIGILAAIALANFLGARQKSQLASVKGNMHTCQLCSESYATDAGGAYGASGSALSPYYPTGSSTIGGTPGILPANPITETPNQGLYTEAISTSVQIQSTRTSPPSAASSATQGQVGYNQCDNGTSYCVCGADQRTFRMAGPGGGTVVLSNQ